MVKPPQSTEELVENWTLVPQELERVLKKVGAGQIGFDIRGEPSGFSRSTSIIDIGWSGALRKCRLCQTRILTLPIWLSSSSIICAGSPQVLESLSLNLSP